ncbi:MAG: hypothetical protein K0U68_05110 [Gammaproteobacteria bacterium]|nr:hypothetical protein [Gammaproteobacteria bacterium]
MKSVLCLQIICWFIAMTLTSACSEDTRVILHEAHVYKGQSDAHPNNRQERDDQLRQRALLVFSDR